MDLASSTVAVTGATGFIGRYLVRALKGRGARVVAAVRSPEKLTEPDVEARRADLADTDSLARAFDGCDAVISNAGLVSIGVQSKAALTAANVEGTRNVFDAARCAGVSRVVMTSSASAYVKKKRGIYVESDPLWSPDARVSRPLYYPVSKAAAEREAWRLAGRYDIDLSVARPFGVYGAHDNTGFTSWLMRFTSIPLMTVFPTHLYIPNVYAGDLAETMVRMLERPAASGKAYNVSGDPEVSFWALLDAYRTAGGDVPRWVLPIPVPFRIRFDVGRAERDLDFSNREPIAAFSEILALR